MWIERKERRVSKRACRVWICQVEVGRLAGFNAASCNLALC